MNLIIFAVVVYIIWKKFGKNFVVSLEQALEGNDFNKIVKIKTTSTKTYYTAIKNGENYLIVNLNVIKNPDVKDIDDVAKVMEEIHYHYCILITKAAYSESIKAYAEEKEIQVMYYWDLLNNRNKYVKIDTNSVIENVVEKIKVNDR